MPPELAQEYNALEYPEVIFCGGAFRILAIDMWGMDAGLAALYPKMKPESILIDAEIPIRHLTSHQVAFTALLVRNKQSFF